MRAYETKDARKDKALILKSCSKSVQNKLQYAGRSGNNSILSVFGALSG